MPSQKQIPRSDEIAAAAQARDFGEFVRLVQRCATVPTMACSDLDAGLKCLPILFAKLQENGPDKAVIALFNYLL